MTKIDGCVVNAAATQRPDLRSGFPLVELATFKAQASLVLHARIAPDVHPGCGNAENAEGAEGLNPGVLSVSAFLVCQRSRLLGNAITRLRFQSHSLTTRRFSTVVTLR